MKKQELLDWWVNYDNSQGVKFKDIPIEYRKSFNDFMLGQTIIRDDNGDDIAYSWDVGQWIYLNTKTEY